METQERSLEPARCLGPTSFVEAGAPEIADVVRRRVRPELAPELRAAALFRFVRDEIAYEFLAKLGTEDYRATRVLREGRGFCVQKAVLLCALGRAASVPTALVLCDLKDRSLPERIVRAIGTDTMFHHGLNAFHVGGRWLLADASLSPDVVRRKRYRLVEFDGTADALSAATTIDGAPHAEYVRFHGMYEDLPFEQMIAAYARAYANVDVEALASLAYRA